MLTVYVSLVFIGVIILAISLVFGADHDIEHEVDFDHDIDFDHDVDLDHDVDASHEFDSAGMSPSKFSVKLIMAFIIGFGFGGVLGLKGMSLSTNQSLFSAIPCALIFYWGAFIILRWLYRQHITTHIRSRDLVGNEAFVVTAVKAGGIGEIKSRDEKTGKEEYYKAKGKTPNLSFAKEETAVITGYVAGILEISKKSNDQNNMEE